MKILHTPVRFHPFVGGVEKYVLELSRELVAQGNEVTVVCANEPESPLQDTVDGIKVVRLPYVTKVANTNITPKLLPTLWKSDFDVLHTHIPTPYSADLSALVALFKRKPLVVTYHNDIIGSGAEGLIAKLYNATALRFLLHRAKKIIITQPKYLEYSKYLKPHHNKVVVVPLGVSKAATVPAELQKKPRQLFFLSVLDRHHEYKGLDVLLQAIAEVKNDYPDVQLLVGGKGELVEKYRQMADELGVSQQVQFLGFVPDEDVPMHYASSAAFVLPSVNSLEGFGIVALEALTYGTPVITTDLAGSSAYIKEYGAGIVIPPRDVAALANAIRTMLQDPQAAAAQGAAGKAVVADAFSWATIAKQMTDIYRNK